MEFILHGESFKMWDKIGVDDARLHKTAFYLGPYNDEIQFEYEYLKFKKNLL